MYCLDNPVNSVDPDGLDVEFGLPGGLGLSGGSGLLGGSGNSSSSINLQFAMPPLSLGNVNSGEAPIAPEPISAPDLGGKENASQGESSFSGTNAIIAATSGNESPNGEGNSIENEDRNPAQDKSLTNDDIQNLKDAGIDPEELKGGKSTGGMDLYKDAQGNVYVKGKGGVGPGEPTGINLNNL